MDTDLNYMRERIKLLLKWAQDSNNLVEIGILEDLLGKVEELKGAAND